MVTTTNGPIDGKCMFNARNPVSKNNRASINSNNMLEHIYDNVTSLQSLNTDYSIETIQYSQQSNCQGIDSFDGIQIVPRKAVCKRVEYNNIGRKSCILVYKHKCK